MSEDRTIYRVVYNKYQQYSIWPADRELPKGWKAMGFEGPKADCEAHVKEILVDLREIYGPERLAEAQRQEQGSGG